MDESTGRAGAGTVVPFGSSEARIARLVGAAFREPITEQFGQALGAEVRRAEARCEGLVDELELNTIGVLAISDAILAARLAIIRRFAGDVYVGHARWAGRDRGEDR